VVLGATDVPVSYLKVLEYGVFRILVLLILTVFPLLGASPSFAIEETSPLHYSAERQLWNRRANKVELFGRAILRQPGEILTAEYILLNLEERTVQAKGNCVYTATDTVIHGEEMRFNLDTRTGSIVSGRVSNDRFSLSGERINKLGAGRFQTHWGEYSTCRDCPQSWSFQAEDVDLEVEGYAYLKNVTVKIQDTPSVWFPYLVVPIKTRRQSGLLFPTLKVNDQHGFIFVLPFFWALDESADMTFGLGQYTARGRRLEWEGRYALTPRSSGTARFFHLNDTSAGVSILRDPGDSSVGRWALDISQIQELPWGIEAKTRILEVSDNLYPNFVGDVPGAVEPVLSSDLSFSKTSSELSAFVDFRRMRNLLNTNPDPRARIELFDSRTVQKLPEAVITTNDQFLFNTPFIGGVSVGVANFTRSSGPFDFDQSRFPFGQDPANSGLVPLPGVDPVREATRVAVTPMLYTAVKPFEIASVIPSLTYYSYFYSFHNALPNLNRGYLHFQTELNTQLERIYDTDDPVYPKSKHLIRPFLLYSRIPYVREDAAHPFLRQIRESEGYNFDNRDIVPLDASPSNINYFVPLGNSLSYGFTTQLIRKRGNALVPGSASYQRSIEFSARQAINFKRSDQRFSRLSSRLGFTFDQFSWGTDFSYTPYTDAPPEILNSSATYVFERATKHLVLQYDRSLMLSYSYDKSACGRDSPIKCGTNALSATVNFSLSDHILPTFTSEYNLVEKKFMSQKLNVAFQSPSRCWKFAFAIGHNVTSGFVRSYDLAINLTGAGFGISDLANDLIPGQ